jgi:hypothetical protein
MINNAKSVFLAVYLGLTMLVACTQPGFLTSYWSARFWTFLQVSALTSHWLEDCANCKPTPEENYKFSAFVQYKQQAYPLLSRQNYTLLPL